MTLRVSEAAFFGTPLRGATRRQIGMAVLNVTPSPEGVWMVSVGLHGSHQATVIATASETGTLEADTEAHCAACEVLLGYIRRQRGW